MTLKEAYKILFEDTNEYSEIEILSRLNEDSIKRNYRELSKKYHPDYNKNNLEFANQKQQQINEAHDILKESLKKHIKNLADTNYEILIEKYKRALFIRECSILKITNEEINKVENYETDNIFKLIEILSKKEKFISTLETLNNLRKEQTINISNVDKTKYTPSYLEEKIKEYAKENHDSLLNDELYNKFIDWYNENKKKYINIKDKIDWFDQLENKYLVNVFLNYIAQIEYQREKYEIYMINLEITDLTNIINNKELNDDTKIINIKQYLSNISKLKENIKSLKDTIKIISEDVKKTKNLNLETVQNYLNQINKNFEDEFLGLIKNNKQINEIKNDNAEKIKKIEPKINQLQLKLINQIDNIIRILKEQDEGSLGNYIFSSIEQNGGIKENIFENAMYKQFLTDNEEAEYKNILNNKSLDFFQKTANLHILYEKLVDKIKKENNQELYKQTILNNESKYISKEKAQKVLELKKLLNINFETLIKYYYLKLKIHKQDRENDVPEELYKAYQNGQKSTNPESIEVHLTILNEAISNIDKNKLKINPEHEHIVLDEIKKGIYIKSKLEMEAIEWTMQDTTVNISKEEFDDILEKTENIQILKDSYTEKSIIELYNFYEELKTLYYKIAHQKSPLQSKNR